MTKTAMSFAGHTKSFLFGVILGMKLLYQDMLSLNVMPSIIMIPSA